MQASKQRLRILLVGKEGTLRVQVEKALSESHYYLVDAASDNAKAWQLVTQSEQPYNVVVIDDTWPVTLGAEPERSGKDLMGRIKSRHPQTEFIILTDIERAADASRTGGSHWLASPFDPDELVSLIHSTARYQRQEGASREKQILERLLEMSAATLKGQSEQEALDSLVRNIQAIGFDSVGLYLVSDDGRYLVGRSHVGMNEGFVGSEWEIANDTYLQAILNAPHLSVCSRGDAELACFEGVLVEEGVDEWACVPLVLRGRVVGHIVADNRISRNPIVKEDLSPIALFTSQAATAIESARLYSETEKRARNLNAVLKVSTAVNSTLDLDQTLSQACQSAVELLGVSHSGLVLFDPRSGSGTVRAEYPEIGAKDLPIQVRGVPIEERLLKSREPIVIEDLAKEPSFGPVRDKMLDLGIRSVLIVPVMNKEQMLGSFGLDIIDKTRRFTQEEIELCKVFAAQAAIAIANAQLFELTKQRADELESLRRATRAITSQLDRDTLLTTIIQEAIKLLKAKGGGIYEYHEERGELTVIIDYNRPDRCGITLKEGEGVAGQLVRDKRPFWIEDDYNNWPGRAPVYAKKPPFGSVVEVPLKWQEETIGIVYIEDEVGRKFTQEDASLLALFADQAAIALMNAELIGMTKRGEEELVARARVRLHIAAQAMSGAFDLKQVLQSVVKNAKNMLQGDSSTIWPYDDGLSKFIPEELETDGIPPEFLDAFRSLEPQPGGITFHVKDMDWTPVSDVDAETEEFQFLQVPRRELLKQIGIKSFQGIALKVGDEPVGVLYVNYNRPRTFCEEDRGSMESLARYAALSLKKAKLLQRVTKSKSTAKVVAQVMALGDREATLSLVTQGTLDTLGCDAVTLYVYDQRTNKCEHPPTMVGVRDTDQASRSEASPDSIVYTMLRRDQPCFVEEVYKDPYFKETRFAKEEGIKSCVAIPLRAFGHTMGVMFVNYRRRHRFTTDELTDIELFADQAAVAIRNTQLLKESHVKLHEQEALVELSRELLGTVNLQEILDRAVAIAQRELKTDFCNIVLPDKDGNLFFVAQKGWKGVEIGTTRMESGKGSQTGFTIERGLPVRVVDYAKETRFTPPPIIFENGIVSGLSVPMFIGGEPVGAMLVHTKALHHFEKAEETLLSLIADQTAAAMKSAQQYNALDRKSAYLSALYEAGKVITASFGLERREILRQIVKQAVKCVIGSRENGHGFGTIQLYEEETNELVFESFYSPNESPRPLRPIGSRRPLGEKEMGITGRTVRTKEPQLVPDVSEDGDYITFDPRTRSELTVPLLEKEKVLGVLSLESDHTEAFDEDDLNTLQALAELAVIALHNARQYDDLEQTKGLVGARTALAWMGMATNAWSHSIAANAIHIRNQVTLLREKLKKNSVGVDTLQLAEERLGRIDRDAVEILDRQIIAPLSEEGIQSVNINELIERRINQLWENEPYNTTQRRLELSAPDNTTVRCNPEWLRRALDNVIDNAVMAMAGVSNRLLVISTKLANGDVEVVLADTGPGIPEEILPGLFKQTQHPPYSKGMGIGLLMAQLVVEVYGGGIAVRSTGPGGTTLVIRLPLERESK